MKIVWENEDVVMAIGSLTQAIFGQDVVSCRMLPNGTVEAEVSVDDGDNGELEEEEEDDVE